MGLSGIVVILIFILQVVCLYRIMGKAGYNPLWGLVSIIPLGAIVLLVVLAFTDWPRDRLA